MQDTLTTVTSTLPSGSTHTSVFSATNLYDFMNNHEVMAFLIILIVFFVAISLATSIGDCLRNITKKRTTLHNHVTINRVGDISEEIQTTKTSTVTEPSVSPASKA